MYKLTFKLGHSSAELLYHGFSLYSKTDDVCVNCFPADKNEGLCKRMFPRSTNES